MTSSVWFYVLLCGTVARLRPRMQYTKPRWNDKVTLQEMFLFLINVDSPRYPSLKSLKKDIDLAHGHNVKDWI